MKRSEALRKLLQNIKLFFMQMMYYCYCETHNLPFQNYLKFFFKVSNYYANCLKSTILRLCIDKPDVAALVSPYYLHLRNIKYLGINISPKLSELFSLNFAPPLLKVQDDLNRWSKVPILLIESIAMFKMLVLPKMNYLFSIISNFPKYGLMVTPLYQNSIGKIKTPI